MPPDDIYVEFLTAGSWFRLVLPALERLANKNHLSKPCCYVFDATPLGWLAASLWSKAFGFHIERLDFEIVDIHDEKGQTIYWRVSYQDIIEIQKLILGNGDFQNFVTSLDPNSYAALYLAKVPVCSYDLYGFQKYGENWHLGILTQVARWHQRKLNKPVSYSLYVNQRPWMKELTAYVRSYGGELYSLGKLQLWRWQWSALKAKLGKINFRLLKATLRRKIFDLKLKYGLAKFKPSFSTEMVRLHTEYYGQFNPDQPSCHNDIFFCDEKNLNYRDILLTFNLSADPLDERKWQLLKSHHIVAVTLTPQASVVEPSLIEAFSSSTPPSTQVYQSAAIEDAENRESLISSLAQYQTIRRYWSDFFNRYNIKLYTSWLNCEPSQMAIADAVADVGGISAIYQRSFEPNPCPQFALGTDVIFSFSPARYKLMQSNHGRFRHHVSVGYLGDYRFGPARPKADEIRGQILRAGAQHIIAYFDENTVQDGRWFISHLAARENYRFLLEKLLSDPSLGLVLKPKKPSNLRQRLGKEVSGLLDEAIRTGRCFMFEGGGLLLGSFSPCVAALAGDIAIHDSLIAGTAGLESALTGQRTLLMDMEGWARSPFYKLGSDVVFKDWNSAWNACQSYFQDPKGTRFGDWTPLIDEFDPFHDGRAAERMSWYLKELLEGLRRKEKRPDIMERTAEQYARRWGKDKVQRRS